MTTTHTYAILEVSAAAYEEIYAKLSTPSDYRIRSIPAKEFLRGDGSIGELHRAVIDMHGIALAKEEALAGAGSNNVSADRIIELEVRLENVTNPPCEFCPHRAHEHEAPGADCDQPCNKCECDGFYPREGTDWTPPSLDKKESR